ncbi:hypothetical protein WICPIJ_001458 [Wickerhamomyces pijperi]|uniref:Uncharacterized protein n=1 Tax=Wickerhamomyces pijperi TaxID=599730 RepID=A0A9P8QAR6_WICPI|nr:hypothetical protein WICPIJ_001458 [Wickerhamomyces pijperi]
MKPGIKMLSFKSEFPSKTPLTTQVNSREWKDLSAKNHCMLFNNAQIAYVATTKVIVPSRVFLDFPQWISPYVEPMIEARESPAPNTTSPTTEPFTRIGKVIPIMR